jgi:hypothetical protein
MWRLVFVSAFFAAAVVEAQTLPTPITEKYTLVLRSHVAGSSEK